MTEADDQTLLREYVEHDSDIAFETILNRHINLVYSTALRQVREPVLASEVTQTTFIILAQKAGSLKRETIVSGWLYRTAQFAAARVLRTEARRREREREAATMQTEHTETVWEQLAPILDQAMGQLSDADRNAVVLRYFENKTSRDVGEALGINEATAQKRVARAMEKMRAFCNKRGVILPVAALTTIISANAVQAAPMGALTATATAIKGVSLSAATTSLVKGTLSSLLWSKLKIAALSSLGVSLVVGTVVLVPHCSEPRTHGWPISSWLAQLDDGKEETRTQVRWEPWQPEATRTPKQVAAAQAIQTMGTNALPYLLAALEQGETVSHQIFGKYATSTNAWHHQAALALDALGPQAAPIIPELTRILHGATSPKEAAIALSAIGPAGWEVLTQSILDTNGFAGACSIWALGSHRAAVPGTVAALKTSLIEGDKTGLSGLSGWALERIGQDREEVVSLLIKSLSYQRSDYKWASAVALGHFGRDARNAVPALLALLQSHDKTIRHDAAQALEQIAPDAAAQAGVTGALATEHIPFTRPD